MQRVDELIAALPAFAPLADGHRATIAGCASNRAAQEGELLMR